MPRPVAPEIDIQQLKEIYEAVAVLNDPRPLMIATMRACNASYQQIGTVFGITRQRAEQIMREALEEI